MISFNLIACQSSVKKASDNENGSLDMKVNTGTLIGLQKNIELTIELVNVNHNVLLQDFKLKVTLLEEIRGKNSQINYIDHKDISHAATFLHEALPYFTITKELSVNERILKIKFELLPTESVEKLLTKFELFDNHGQLVKDCTVVWEKEKADVELIQGNPQPLKGSDPIHLTIKNKSKSRISNNKLKLKVTRKLGNVAAIEEAILQNNELYITLGAIEPENHIEKFLHINPGTDVRVHFNIQLWCQEKPLSNSIEIIWEKPIGLTIQNIAYDKDTGKIGYTISNQSSETAKGVKLSYYTNTLQQKLAGKQVMTLIWQEVTIGNLASDQKIAGQIPNKVDFSNNKIPELVVKLSYDDINAIVSLEQQKVCLELSDVINNKIKQPLLNQEINHKTTPIAAPQMPTQSDNSLEILNPAIASATDSNTSLQHSITEANIKQDAISLANQKTFFDINIQPIILGDSLKNSESVIISALDSITPQLLPANLVTEDSNKKAALTLIVEEGVSINAQFTTSDNSLKEQGAATKQSLESIPLQLPALNPLVKNSVKGEPDILAVNNVPTADIQVTGKFDNGTRNMDFKEISSSCDSTVQFLTAHLAIEGNEKKALVILDNIIETSIDKKVVSLEKEKTNSFKIDILEEHGVALASDMPINDPVSLALLEKKNIEVELSFKGKIGKLDYSFEDREIGIIEITNKGHLPINTKNIHITLVNTKGIYFKLGNRAASSHINTTLNKLVASKELQPGQFLDIQLQLHSNSSQIHTFTANLNLELLDQDKHVLAKGDLIWLNKQHKLYKSVKNFNKVIEKYKKEFTEIVRNTEDSFKAACRNHYSTKNDKNLDKWRSGLKSVILKAEVFQQVNKQYEVLLDVAYQELDIQISNHHSTKGRLLSIRNFIDSVKTKAENLVLEFEQFYLFNLENTKNRIIYIHELIKHKIQTELIKLNDTVRIDAIRNSASSITARRDESKSVAEQSSLTLCTELSMWLNELMNLTSNLDMENINMFAKTHASQFIPTIKHVIKEANNAENAAKLCIVEVKDSIAKAFFNYILQVEKQIKSETSHTKLAIGYQLLAEAYQFLAEFDYAFLASRELIEDAKASHRAAAQAASAAQQANKNKIDHEANQAAKAAYSAAIIVYKYFESIFDIYEMQKKEAPADYYQINLKYIKDTIRTLLEIRDGYVDLKVIN
jgi:hypothetical protein